MYWVGVFKPTLLSVTRHIDVLEAPLFMEKEDTEGVEPAEITLLDTIEQRKIPNKQKPINFVKDFL